MKVIVDNFAKRINRELEITDKINEKDINMLLNAIGIASTDMHINIHRKRDVSVINDIAAKLALYAMIIANKYDNLRTGQGVPIDAEVLDTSAKHEDALDAFAHACGVLLKEDAPAREPDPVENHPADNFDILWDRIYSLLGRWKTFHDNNLDKPKISNFCIKGLLSEINDDYTALIRDQAEVTERSENGVTYEQMYRLFMQRYGTATKTVRDYRPFGPNSIILEHSDGSLSKVVYQPKTDKFIIEADYDERE